MPLLWLFWGTLGIGSVLLVSLGTIASPQATDPNSGEAFRHQVSRQAPPGMAWIPGGTSLMGTNEKESFPNERPARLVQVQGFWMDVHDVTNAQFARFVFVWGDDFRPGGRYLANTWQGSFPVHDSGEDGFAGTSPVGAFPANGYGLYDMAGNVWQWCSDWYRADAHLEAASHNVCRDPGGPIQSFDPGGSYAPKRVVKGGSFLCNPNYCQSYRPSARRGTPPDTGSSHTGFRCVISANDARLSRPTERPPSLTE